MARVDDAAPSPISAAPERVGFPLRTVGRIAVRSSSIVALAIAWEAFSRSGAVTPFMLPALSAVLERIWSDAIAGDLLLNIGTTLYRAIA